MSNIDIIKERRSVRRFNGLSRPEKRLINESKDDQNSEPSEAKTTGNPR